MRATSPCASSGWCNWAVDRRRQAPGERAPPKAKAVQRRELSGTLTHNRGVAQRALLWLRASGLRSGAAHCVATEAFGLIHQRIGALEQFCVTDKRVASDDDAYRRPDVASQHGGGLQSVT